MKKNILTYMALGSLFSVMNSSKGPTYPKQYQKVNQPGIAKRKLKRKKFKIARRKNRGK